MAIAVVDNPFASYHAPTREQAARERLTFAIEELDEAIRAWEARGPMDPDERRILRETMQGAKNQVRTWERYLKGGCPRARG